MVPSPSKSYYPLESNPEVFNELIGLLGVSLRLQFQDIYSLDEPELLPHPTLALILVFPADEVLAADAQSDRPEYSGFGDEEPVVWFKQTIGNACGLYAVLHGVVNGARGGIEPDGLLGRILEECIPLPPEGRAKVLEESEELEEAHSSVAVKGQSEVPARADEEVEFHYVAFVRDGRGRVWELDGDRKEPIDTGVELETGEDVCSEKVLGLVRGYVLATGRVEFGLMGLVDGGGE